MQLAKGGCQLIVLIILLPFLCCGIGYFFYHLAPNTPEKQITNSLPDWYNKKFVTNIPEKDKAMIVEINVWDKPDDTNGLKTKIGIIQDSTDINLIGYDGVGWCKVSTNEIKGWISCGFLKGIPEQLEKYP